MDSNKTTQVNINRPKRDGVPPWAWGAIAAAALALILGTIFFVNQPKSQPAVAPTPTATPVITVVEVTSTPDANAPTATPVMVEVTATAGASATPQPTATARIVQITATSAPTTAAPPTVTTSKGGTTPTVAPTTGTQATASPAATLTADEQRVLDSLKLAQGGDKVTVVHLIGGNLTVEFQAPDAAGAGASATARQLVRNLLSGMSQNTVTYSKLMLKGMITAAPGSQGTAVIDLTYDQNTVSTTDWASVQDADVYNKAEAKTLQPPFDSAP